MKKMKFSDVVKEVKKHTWLNEEAPMRYQFIGFISLGFIIQNKVFHPDLIRIAFFSQDEKSCYERTPGDDKYAVHMFVYENMLKDENYLTAKRDEYVGYGDNMLKEGFKMMKDISSMSNNQIYDSYSYFMKNYTEFLAFGGGIECVDGLTQDKIDEVIEKELPNISQEEVREIILALSSSLFLSFMEKERISFLETCIKYYDDIKNNKISANLTKKLKEHANNYFYVLSNFKDPRFLNSDDFLEKCKEEVKADLKILETELKNLKTKLERAKKKEKETIKKYNLSKETRIFMKTISLIAEYIDERKSYMLRGTNFLGVYCKEISRRFNIDISDLKDYDANDTKKLLLTGKPLSNEILKNRRKCSVILCMRQGDEIKEQWFYGDEARKLIDLTADKIESDLVKGIVASSPVKKMQGKVQIIFDVNEEKFDKGNILVTSQTRPEFVPLMRRAKAIITDEGGLTCHAAVVSRELGIPCIVGTKNATRVFKDGDYVEVDADKGIVRLLKRKR